MASSFLTFLDHTQRRTTVDRTPLDERSARRRDLYLTTHNTHNRHPCPPGGIRTHNLSRRAAAALRLRPRGHLDRQYLFISKRNTEYTTLIRERVRESLKDGGDLSPQKKAMSTGDVHIHCSKHYQNFQSRYKYK